MNVSLLSFTSGAGASPLSLVGEAMLEAKTAGVSLGLRSREAPALAAAISALRAAISASVASLIGPCKP